MAVACAAGGKGCRWHRQQLVHLAAALERLSCWSPARRAARAAASIGSSLFIWQQRSNE
jgi:hypothetical protein